MPASRPASFTSAVALAAVLALGLVTPASSATGPYLVKDINGSGASNPSELTVVGDTLFFAAKGPGGRELWKSDGTAAGTVRVKNIRPGAKSSDPRGLMNMDGTLYFAANDGSHGYELWRSDGTTAGTTMVADMGIGDDLAGPLFITDILRAALLLQRRARNWALD